MLSFAFALMTALTPTADAGGIGLLATGGFHDQTVYFYDSSDNNEKYSLSETIGNYGAGLEVILGDRDDKITGRFRAYWLGETPEYNPADVTVLVAPGNVVASWREETRHVGVLTVGLQFGVFGNPNDLQMTIVADIGSGVLTVDHTEYLSVEAGVGLTKGFPGATGLMRDIQLFASIGYILRNDRGLSHGGNGYAGIRYMFD